MNSTATSAYSLFSRVVHWLTALLMIGLFVTGYIAFGGPPHDGPPPSAGDSSTAVVDDATAPALSPSAALMPNGPSGVIRPPMSEDRLQLIALHTSMGMTVLWLAVARLVYRFFGRMPALPSSMPRWQRIAARSNQYLLYAALLIQPLSGWIGSSTNPVRFKWFGLFTQPGLPIADRDTARQLMDFHGANATVILVLVGLHTLGALYHHYVRKDDVLRSMVSAK